MTVLTTLDGTLKQCYECIADSEEFSLIDVSAVDPVNRLKRVLIGQNLSPPPVPARTVARPGDRHYTFWT